MIQRVGFNKWHWRIGRRNQTCFEFGYRWYSDAEKPLLPRFRRYRIQQIVLLDWLRFFVMVRW